MARKIVSEQEAQKSRIYGDIRILSDGRIRFVAQPGAIHALKYSVQRHHWREPGVWVYDSADYSIAVQRRGEIVLFLSVVRSRAASACFNINLPPDTLRRAVADLRKTGNGVERWLTPGLERMREGLEKRGRNPEALEVIPGLLRSLRDVPRVEATSQVVARKRSRKRAARKS